MAFKAKHIKVFKLICRIKKLVTWQKKNLLTYFICHLQDLYCWPWFHLDQLQLVTCVHSPRLPALTFRLQSAVSWFITYSHVSAITISVIES